MVVSVLCGDLFSQVERLDERGRVLAGTRLSNAHSCDSQQLLEGLLQAGQVASGDTVLFALPGLQRQEVRSAAEALLERVLSAGVRSWLCDSLEPLLLAALGGRPGWVVHSSRRAAVASCDVAGRFTAWSSPGAELGDEGSALWLGAHTLQWLARTSRPGMVGSPRLEQQWLPRLGCSDLAGAIAGFESGRFGASELLALAALCEQLAAYPDPEPACRALLSKLSRVLIPRLEGADLVSWDGPVLGPTLRSLLQGANPALQMVEPAYPIEVGCRLLALAANAAPPASEPVPAVDDAVRRRAMQMVPEFWQEGQATSTH